MIFCFFFSSRRRHTRCLSDWSSDVCSSDLRELNALHQPEFFLTRNQFASCIFVEASCPNLSPVGLATRFALVYPGARRRSEERRVGKECRSRWSADR